MCNNMWCYGICKHRNVIAINFIEDTANETSAARTLGIMAGMLCRKEICELRVFAYTLPHVVIGCIECGHYVPAPDTSPEDN